jgi:hypothetical protein
MPVKTAADVALFAYTVEATSWFAGGGISTNFLQPGIKKIRNIQNLILGIQHCSN